MTVRQLAAALQELRERGHANSNVVVKVDNDGGVGELVYEAVGVFVVEDSEVEIRT